jgi:Bacterial Ig-like domain
MHIGQFGSWAALVAVILTTACAGSGDGLNQNGQPTSAGAGAPAPITADFQSIQDNVFTPICSKCHIGASAPEGLQLDAAHSFNLLVGVPSVEEPKFLRVSPGDPDDSYMLQKIEGAAGIEGGQMPLGETPLPQATIDAMRQWITNGAQNSASAMASAFAVQTTAPMDTAVVQTPISQVVVAFTQEVDASLVNNTTVTLERLGDTTPEPLPNTTVARAENNPAVILITPSAALAAGTYRVTLRGTNGAALANLNAVTLGSDVAFTFTVEPAQ